MNSELCDKLGIEFPLFAFTHCRDVVAEVTNAGGFGVLGAVGLTPDSLEIEMDWIDKKVQGKPYGIDLLIPTRMEDKAGVLTDDKLREQIPMGHRKFVEELLDRHGIDSTDLWNGEYDGRSSDNMREVGALKLIDVAFNHPIKLFVNALGVPPKSVMERARERGIMVGALTGAREHAVKAAGGIATDRQMAACMAMGAAGAWTGSVWLTTTEAETTPTVKEKMLKATSRQTVRSRSRTGKPTRHLQSAWSDAWATKDAPDPLPMPLQGLLSRPPFSKIDKLAAGGHSGAKELAAYFVGQAVGLMNAEQSARSVVLDFKRDFAEAVERLSATLAD